MVQCINGIGLCVVVVEAFLVYYYGIKFGKPYYPTSQASEWIGNTENPVVWMVIGEYLEFYV